ncbi:MAG: ThuA domain-containing protein [Pseudomonadota bacterium]
MTHAISNRTNSAILASALIAAACTNGEAQDEPDVADPPAAVEIETPVVYDAIPPDITKWMQQPAILVFSKTNGWRHNEGIAGGDKFFVELSREKGFGIFTTVNAAVFNETDLARFDVIVFNNATGDTLSPDQEAAFQTWLEAGGAWIGLHGSGDNTHEDWAWYADSLIGPTFTGHPLTPHFHVVRVETLDSDHVIMTGAPDVWEHDDEWYFFDSHPKDYGLRPLVGIHETDFKPIGSDVQNLATWAMGDTPADHPVIWVGCPGDGRSFYTALGHSDVAYDNQTYRTILTQAFDWVRKTIDETGAGCPAAE